MVIVTKKQINQLYQKKLAGMKLVPVDQGKNIKTVMVITKVIIFLM